jgi:hypothetical protein
VSIECELGDQCLDLDVPYIVFGFRIRNNSVFDITVEDELTGHVVFREMPLKGRKDLLQNGAKDVPFRGWGGVTLKLLLSLEEARHISKSVDDIDANFYFHDLTLTIKGGSRFQEITPTRLPTNAVAIHIRGDSPAVWATKVEQAKLNWSKCQTLAWEIRDLSQVAGAGMHLADELANTVLMWGTGRKQINLYIETFDAKLKETISRHLGEARLIDFLGPDATIPDELVAQRKWMETQIAKLKHLIWEVITAG